MKKSYHSSALYKKLWKDAGSHYRPEQKVKTRSTGEELIEEICFRADLCETSKDYVQTLCQGMIMLLEANVPLESLKNHPVLKQKVNSIPEELMNGTPVQSDQWYIGIFAKLRIKTDWLKLQFYHVLHKMLQHVFRQTQPLSNSIKKKIEFYLKRDFPKQYKVFFSSPLALGTF